MNVGYVKQEEVPLKLIDRIKYFLGMINVSKYEEGHVFRIPMLQKEKKVNRVIKRLLKQIQKMKVDTIVFSDNLIDTYFYCQIQEILYEKKYQILEGRKLMFYMKYDILEYILKMQKTEIGREDIYFLIKKDATLNLQFLSKFIENCKTVNIVTNDMDRFKKIQEDLYEKENILIGVSNHKAKALKRAKYILNINMDKKELDKFKINRNAIIINFKENIKYNNNTFDGINVTYFQISLPDELIERFERIEGMDQFNKVKLYESLLLQKIEHEKNKSVIISKDELIKRKKVATDIILEDEVKIIGLLGNNGKIDDGEIIRNYQKNLTKDKN